MECYIKKYSQNNCKNFHFIYILFITFIIKKTEGKGDYRKTASRKMERDKGREEKAFLMKRAWKIAFMSVFILHWISKIKPAMLLEHN